MLKYHHIILEILLFPTEFSTFPTRMFLSLLLSPVILSSLMLLASNTMFVVLGAPVEKEAEKAPWQVQYERIFQSEDIDNDGGLNYDELQNLTENGYRCFRDMTVYLREEFKSLDADKDNNITFDELQANGNATFVPVNNTADLKTYFKFYDINQDGVITRADIGAYLLIFASLGLRYEDEPAIRKEFVEFDENEDGKLQLNETSYASLLAFSEEKSDNASTRAAKLGVQVEGFMRCHEKKQT